LWQAVKKSYIGEGVTVKKLPPLNATRAFETAARLGSYVEAARELNVTQPAIGRHIKTLEAFLKTQLFKRTPRGVVLTDDGWTYYQKVAAALSLIADATHEFTSRSEERWLRLLVAPGFAGRWLKHHLAEFRALHPNVRIALEPNASFRELPDDRTDLGIAFGLAERFVGLTEKLCQPAIFPVCSPSFLERYDAPTRVEKLSALPLLHEDDGYWWSAWLNSQGVKVRPSAEMSYVSVEQVIDLAIAGAGIGLVNSLLVAREMNSGQLVRPLPHEARLEGYVFLYPPGGLKAEARAFRQWLLDKLNSEDM